MFVWIENSVAIQTFVITIQLSRQTKKMFNLDEAKIECALGNRELFFGRARRRDCCVFISDVGTRGIYLSLTLGTAKFNHQINHVLL